MTKIISKMNDNELTEMMTEIEAKKLCYLMSALDSEEQERVYGLMSDDARRLLENDIAKITS